MYTELITPFCDDGWKGYDKQANYHEPNTNQSGKKKSILGVHETVIDGVNLKSKIGLIARTLVSRVRKLVKKYLFNTKINY